MKDSKVSKGECSPTSNDAQNTIEDNVSQKGNVNKEDLQETFRLLF